jgi:hypothetical protein
MNTGWAERYFSSRILSSKAGDRYRGHNCPSLALGLESRRERATASSSRKRLIHK